jgi:tRNA(Ile)-lysidine synthase
MAVKAMLGLDRTLFKAGERVCVALSGGADSTALLLGLVEACGGKDGLGVVVSAAHVHHGLRGADADADEAFVGELCERLRVGLTVFHVDTAARMEAAGEGLEEAARELRYAALRGLDVDVVATAHTLDDQAETVVMKMLRGAWTEGLGGISPVVLQKAGSRNQEVGSRNQEVGSRKQEVGSRNQEVGIGGAHKDLVKIVRPLLGVRRSEVEAFLRARGQEWREDGSNRDLSLTRNRVRHQVMPLLREFNPGVDGLLGRTAEIARDEEAFWRAEVGRVLPQVLLPGRPVRGGGRAVSTAVGESSCALEIARLAAMPAALRRRVVRAAVRTLGAGLSSEETAKVLALAGFGGHAGVLGRIGSRLELHGGVRAERSARELRLWRQV